MIGTGSEVQLAVAAREQLAAEGVRARVVSMPCQEWFAEQDRRLPRQVLPPSVRARVSVEAAVNQGWREYVGDAGRMVSLEHYGASADFATLYREFGITAEAVADGRPGEHRGSHSQPGGAAPPAGGATPRRTAAPATADPGADRHVRDYMTTEPAPQRREPPERTHHHG